MDDFLPMNYVRLEGELDRCRISEVSGGSYMFKGSVRVPIRYEAEGGHRKVYYNFFNIIAFGDIALSLSSLGKGSWAAFEGNLEISRYGKRCGHCNGADTTYWTDVRVSNFVELEKPSLEGEVIV